MRTTTISTTQIKYPDANCFVYDNSFISFSDSLYPVGCEINITNLSSMETKTLKYTSELKNLTISINDVIRKLHQTGGCTLNVKVKVYTDLFYTGTFAFEMNTLDGRTLPYRSHGSARTFYVYNQDELQKFQFFFAGSGALSVNGHNFPVISSGRNSFDLRPYITHSGDWQACYRYGVKGGDGKDYTSRVNITDIEPSCFSAVAFLEYTDIDIQPVETEIKGGGTWADSRLNLADYCATIVYEDVCDDFDFIELAYYDTDGILRYLGGKIQNEVTSAKGKNYIGERLSVYRDISQKHIEESSVTVKVGFADIRRDAYPQDLFLSEHVWFKNFNGDWLPCSLNTNKITIKSEETLDLELEIELLKQG